jgi:hypothetical protein
MENLLLSIQRKPLPKTKQLRLSPSRRQRTDDSLFYTFDAVKGHDFFKVEEAVGEKILAYPISTTRLVNSRLQWHSVGVFSFESVNEVSREIDSEYRWGKN